MPPQLKHAKNSVMSEAGENEEMTEKNLFEPEIQYKLYLVRLYCINVHYYYYYITVTKCPRKVEKTE
jgi:hypothetical protein